jgi:CubicO group peptidase (beta-lactamase class C family)
MRPGGAALALMAAVVVAAIGSPAASAAKACQAPAGDWLRATPAEAGMDAAKLQAAVDYATSQAAYAVRVYRHGCRVAEDRVTAGNREARYESYSMGKSVTAMLFGRAMTQGLISPDDPVGALVPSADGPHGAITMRDLLTMTSGLRWNGFRDYNVFTMPDRVRDALTLEPVRKPGTYFEYAQSPVTLLALAVGRAVGRDAGDFAQRELMTPLGIPAYAWAWARDPAGNIQGFWGVEMRPDDFGRLGELLRRDGVWRGRRLLSKRFMAEALAPSRTNGCYGWLIWVNAAAPCIGPTVEERSVVQGRDFPDMPPDMYKFAGLFGQLVTVFPSQGLVLVRTGQDPGLLPAGGASWEHELYVKLLAAVTDQRIPPTGAAPRVSDERQGPDYGFQTALFQPDQYNKGVSQDPLPPAGPERARAVRLRLARERAGRDGSVLARLHCPRRWLGRTLRRCTGTATLEGARSAVAYDVGAGHGRRLRFRLTAARLAQLRRVRRLSVVLTATSRDAAAGTAARLVAELSPPR